VYFLFSFFCPLLCISLVVAGTVAPVASGPLVSPASAQPTFAVVTDHVRECVCLSFSLFTRFSVDSTCSFCLNVFSLTVCHSVLCFCLFLLCLSPSQKAPVVPTFPVVTDNLDPTGVGAAGIHNRETFARRLKRVRMCAQQTMLLNVSCVLTQSVGTTCMRYCVPLWCVCVCVCARRVCVCVCVCVCVLFKFSC
jgi:hypothetical protein